IAARFARARARLASLRTPARPRLRPARRREAARGADTLASTHPAATGETERPRRHDRDRGSARERAGGALTDRIARVASSREELALRSSVAGAVHRRGVDRTRSARLPLVSPALRRRRDVDPGTAH